MTRIVLTDYATLLPRRVITLVDLTRKDYGVIMQNNIIARLFSSFSDLEKAISSARLTLAQKDSVPAEVVKRLESYDTILAKQRNLAETLQQHLGAGNWDEVSRHISLINGLSAMIRDDARAILSALSLNSDNTQDDSEPNFC